MPSWQEHERQHEGRLTGEDKAIEDAAFAYVTGKPRTHHLLAATTDRSDEGTSLRDDGATGRTEAGSRSWEPASDPGGAEGI